MSAVTRISASGIIIAQYGIVNSTGYVLSTAGALSNGSGGGLGVLRAVKRAVPTNPEPTRSNATGDERKFRHTYVSLPEELPEVDLAFALLDTDFGARMTGIKRFTEGLAAGIIEDHNVQADAVQVCLYLTGPAKSGDTATNGTARYRTRIYPLCNVVALPSSFEEATIADFTYKAYPAQASFKDLTEALNATTHGGTRAASVMYATIYPLTQHTFVGNGTATQVTLDYTPAGDGTTGYMRITSNGTLLATTAYSVAAKVVTLTGAPSSGGVVQVRYEATDLLSSN